MSGRAALAFAAALVAIPALGPAPARARPAVSCTVSGVVINEDPALKTLILVDAAGVTHSVFVTSEPPFAARVVVSGSGANRCTTIWETAGGQLRLVARRVAVPVAVRGMFGMIDPATHRFQLGTADGSQIIGWVSYPSVLTRRLELQQVHHPRGRFRFQLRLSRTGGLVLLRMPVLA